MKHEVTTLNTKKALAAAMKKAVSEKPFSKVTVSKIIKDCGVNRKTFYYHFEDIYALLKWTLEQEAIEVVKQFDLLVRYEDAIYFVMDYVEKNNRFLRNVYNSMGREELKRFFYLDLISVAANVVNESEQKLALTVPEDFKRFIMEFYTEALAGVLLDWIVSYENQNREQTMKYISVVLRASIPNVMQAAAKS